MNTYENYLETPKSLTFDQMRELHQKLLKEIENDPVGQELYDELIGEATTYAEIRAKWLRLDRSQKMEQDSFRTACHNSVITHFNMMARYLKTQGKSYSSRNQITKALRSNGFVAGPNSAGSCYTLSYYKLL